LIIIQQATIHQITSTCHYVKNFAMFDKAYMSKQIYAHTYCSACYTHKFVQQSVTVVGPHVLITTKYFSLHIFTFD